MCVSGCVNVCICMFVRVALSLRRRPIYFLIRTRYFFPDSSVCNDLFGEKNVIFSKK